MTQQQVFISYAWGGESEQVADELEQLLTSKSVRLVRDKTDLGFKGLIREFMLEIGQGHLVVLIISDKYLKSKNCMFELMEVEKRGEFWDRIFPIVLPDADIYDSLGILSYLKYWDQKIKALNTSAKELDNLADTRKVQEDINLYTDIRGAIDALAGKLSNMNTLTLEIMRSRAYQPLVDSLAQKLGKIPDPAGPVKKEGKVLYHIPTRMQVAEWTRCTVRLAWDEILLTEGLTIPTQEQMIESVRLGNIMQVSLAESRNGGNFEIHAITNEEQFIAADDYTEWLFDVKALGLGKFSLILRISLIQIIEGKERKKDLVLEREVTTAALAPRALARFEVAESGLPPTPDFAKEDLEKIENPNQSAEEDFDQDPPFLQKTDSAALPPYPESVASSPPRSSLPPSKPVLRRILPYAASLAGLVLIAFLFLPGYESANLDPPVGEMAPTDNAYSEEAAGAAISGEKFLVALSMEATTPAGESVSDVQLFLVEESQLARLDAQNFEGYQLMTIPTSDTANLNLGPIQTLSASEISDSMTQVIQKPIQIGAQRISRKDLILKRDF